MKGQIFIAGAALFVVLLALIATSFAPIPAIPMAISIAPQLDNLAQEYRYTTGLSSIDKTDHLDELSVYFRNNAQGFDAIYALITATPGAYDLIIGNFLRNPATVSIIATSSNPPTASSAIADKESKSWSFTAAGSVQLTINYTIQNATYTQSLNFTADKNQTISWFDIGIVADRNSIRQSDVWNVT
jgi:hypothetical protein